jgi:hypothetical protein
VPPNRDPDLGATLTTVLITAVRCSRSRP